ncbi:hypothetical protein QL285_025707 [Trifolium repens]|nr:hypothetical protein QL285_025707 [Trifolium repens]
MFMDISTPPPSIKHLELCISPAIDYEITLFSDLLNFLVLCCCPTTISFSLDAATGPFIEFFYETLMRRKENDCFCNSNYTKCWWHDIKDVKITNSMKNNENVDWKTVLDSLPPVEYEKNITFMLEF